MSNPNKRIVVAGLGYQGWAIVRQFVKLWGDSQSYEIYVFDKFREKEDRFLPSELRQQNTTTAGVFEAYKQGRVRKLREISPNLQDELDVQNAIVSLQPDLLVNASTFIGHKFYTETAFKANCDYIDLGQDTWQAMKQRAMDQRIRESGRRLRIIPECGLAPGLGNILGAWLLRYGDDSLQIRVGGLPMDSDKGGEFHYGISWSPDGILQEYTDTSTARKNGRLTSLTGLYSLEDREDPTRMTPGIAPWRVDKDELRQRLNGRVKPPFLAQENSSWAIQNIEARPTSDGISLMPFDHDFSTLYRLEYKTLRYYPHFDTVQRALEDGSLREKLKALPSSMPDLVLLRVWTEEAGTPRSMVEGVILSDPELDHADGEQREMGPNFVFSAMQHLTGWPTVLVASALLGYRDPDQHTRPDLFQEDHTLWSGRSLDTALREGGVIMPYELVNGARILADLDSDKLIPHREFHTTGAVLNPVK